MPPKQQRKRVRGGSIAGESDKSPTSGSSSYRAPNAKRTKSSRQSSVESDGDVSSHVNGPFTRLELQEEKPEEDLDKYCKMCDDGGDLMECDKCGFSYCYKELPPLHDNFEDSSDQDSSGRDACISVPKGYAKDPFTVFYCPECLTNYPGLPFDYHINSGYLPTQRRVVNFQVVILLSYLPGLAERAKTIYDSIRSLLGIFEIVTSAYFLPLPETLHKSNTASILELEYPYHLVFLFLTESNPGGGWWMEDDAQTDEAAWIGALITVYTAIAKKALTARVFGLCCGVNLVHKDTIPAILGAFSGSHWDSIMLPTASGFLPEELATIFPELFGQIYYNGIAFKSAVVRVWATSQRARVHTDLLLIEYLDAELTVQKYRYGSLSKKPYGIGLPATRSFCTCERDGNFVNWKQKGRAIIKKHNEFMCRYKTSCGHAHIDLAIFTGTAKIRQAAGVQVIVEDFDLQKRIFPLDSRDARSMKPFLGGPQSQVVEHTSAWTVYGKQQEATAQAS